MRSARGSCSRSLHSNTIHMRSGGGGGVGGAEYIFKYSQTHNTMSPGDDDGDGTMEKLSVVRDRRTPCCSKRSRKKRCDEQEKSRNESMWSLSCNCSTQSTSIDFPLLARLTHTAKCPDDNRCCRRWHRIIQFSMLPVVEEHWRDDGATYFSCFS